MLKVYFQDNMDFLLEQAAGQYRLIYIDPPFNTGKIQKRTVIRTVHDSEGDRKGFQGKTYSTKEISSTQYNDSFDDYMAFLKPRIEEAFRVLAPNGSFFFHIDYREVHYCKVLIDSIFGRENFMNEIIWAYDYGSRSKNRWSAKHNNILWYVKDKDNYVFNYDEMERIPYMAPGLVGEEKAKLGKTPTDVWWHTIVSPNGKEKTGYVTQKPIGILNRIVKVHSNEGDLLLDFFAGSGSFGQSAINNYRDVVLVDENIEAINVMKKRFALEQVSPILFQMSLEPQKIF